MPLYTQFISYERPKNILRPPTYLNRLAAQATSQNRKPEPQQARRDDRVRVVHVDVPATPVLKPVAQVQVKTAATQPVPTSVAIPAPTPVAVEMPKPVAAAAAISPRTTIVIEEYSPSWCADDNVLTWDDTFDLLCEDFPWDYWEAIGADDPIQDDLSGKVGVTVYYGTSKAEIPRDKMYAQGRANDHRRNFGRKPRSRRRVVSNFVFPSTVSMREVRKKFAAYAEGLAS